MKKARSRKPSPAAAHAPREVAREWQVWCAENLARGAAPAEMVRALVAEGATAVQAAALVEEIAGSATMEVARRLARGARRHALTLELLEKNRRLAPSGARIPRIEWPGAEAIVEQYLATSTPVIVTGLVSTWPACERWQPRALAARFGEVAVEVTSGREADPDYDMRTAAHSASTTLGEYVARIEAATGPTNDFYMVAQNRNLGRGLRGLLDDVSFPDGIVRSERFVDGAQFWLGPAGTVTPLHHDTSSILFCQVVGRKRFRLVAPTELRLLDDARAMYAAVDPEKPDLERFPWWPEVLVRDEVIAPGEMLVLPVGWWHHVRALDVSASLAVNALVVPNKFDDYVPGSL